MVTRAAVAKASRYLVEGRLIVTVADPARRVVEASCRGGRLYAALAFNGAWRCSCPARADCSHLLALRRVVAVDLEAR